MPRCMFAFSEPVLDTGDGLRLPHDGCERALVAPPDQMRIRRSEWLLALRVVAGTARTVANAPPPPAIQRPDPRCCSPLSCFFVLRLIWPVREVRAVRIQQIDEAWWSQARPVERLKFSDVKYHRPFPRLGSGHPSPNLPVSAGAA